MDFGLRGRVVLVTGAGSGIGRATALRLADQGAMVGVGDRDEPAAAAVSDAIARGGGSALPLCFDVVDAPATEAALDRLEGAFGAASGLVACAGLSRPRPAAEMTDAVWDLVIGVNLTGVFQSCQSAGRRMIRGGGGAIVTIGSTASLGGHPGRAHYCASKHGVVGLTKVLALEWGHLGVRTNCVAPGAVETPMLRGGLPPDHIDQVLVDRTPADGLASADDVAGAALFLLSDAARHVNGAVLPVDGGASTGYLNRWNGRDIASNAPLERGPYGPSPETAP